LWEIRQRATTYCVKLIALAGGGDGDRRELAEAKRFIGAK
jgi:hypothetical protein